MVASRVALGTFAPTQKELSKKIANVCGVIYNVVSKFTLFCERTLHFSSVVFIYLFLSEVSVSNYNYYMHCTTKSAWGSC